MKTRIGPFTVSPYPPRNGWKVDAPARVFGKPVRKTFRTEFAALDWASKQHRSVLTGSTDILPTTAGTTVQIAVEKYLAAKEPAVKKQTYQLLKYHLKMLTDQFGSLEPADLRPLKARAWLDSLPHSERTRRGVFISCRSLFRWAVRYELTTVNPFDAMEPIKNPAPPKAILTPAQMRAVLELKMHPSLRAWIILGGFCGLRSIEIVRLDWAAVNLTTNEIHVSSKVIKATRGMRERYVDIPENARALLAGSPTEGRVINLCRSNFLAAIKPLAVKIGLPEWPQNCLRHSAASYHLAVSKDAGKTAFFLGHTSPQMVHAAYARAVTAEAAAEWWAIGR
jgi:integrase